MENEKTCGGQPLPTQPPPGHFNGHWECKDGIPQWFDDIDLTDEENGD